MIGPLSVQIEAFRAKAKDLRARAEGVRDPAIREGLLQIAAEYDRLTIHAEQWSVATKALIMGLPPESQ
jgi:hypothetical protein